MAGVRIYQNANLSKQSTNRVIDPNPTPIIPTAQSLSFSEAIEKQYKISVERSNARPTASPDKTVTLSCGNSSSRIFDSVDWFNYTCCTTDKGQESMSKAECAETIARKYERTSREAKDLFTKICIDDENFLDEADTMTRASACRNMWGLDDEMYIDTRHFKNLELNQPEPTTKPKNTPTMPEQKYIMNCGGQSREFSLSDYNKYECFNLCKQGYNYYTRPDAVKEYSRCAGKSLEDSRKVFIDKCAEGLFVPNEIHHEEKRQKCRDLWTI